MITTIIKQGLLFSLLLVLLQSCGGAEFNFIHEYERRMKIGDDITWKEKNFVDTTWAYYPKNGVEDEIYWTRLKFNFPQKEGGDYKNLGMMTVGDGAHEVYWDGQFIGMDGRLKTDQVSEIPGLYHKYFRLPDSLQQQGEHILALRSTAVLDFDPGTFAYIGDFEKLLTVPLHTVKYLFLIAGAFLITAIYFFFMFIQQPKEYAVLIFSFVCLLFFGLILMEYLKYYYPYTYDFQIKRLIIIGYLHMMITILIPWYFLILFSLPWKHYILGGIALAIVFIENYYYYSYDYSAWGNDQLMWCASLGIVCFAAYKKRKGAIIVGIGIVLVLILFRFVSPYFRLPFVSSYDISLFIGFVIILLLMLYLLTLKRTEERLAYEASLIESERLKNQLLKKNIKPHFIMNTLTSLIDWVEESPKEGVQFINALAGEFEVLNQIADYKLVPIQQEIKLCKNHLKVMSYRKEIDYIWEEEGIDDNEIIPPAIIHTIVENGVTHSLPDENGKITFKLSYNKKNTSQTYRLQTIASNRPTPSKEFKKAEGGTGLRYIKSRLQESYGDKWKVTSKEITEGWETEIVFWS